MRVDPARLARRTAELSAVGGNGTKVTRIGLGAEEQAARDLVGGWLAARGAKLRRDPAANLIARFGGDGPAVCIASHLDSVPDGGRFDGALGVLCAVEAIESLLDSGARFRRPVEVIGWADEEGAGTSIGLFGSSAMFGRLPDDASRRAGRGGRIVADALRALGEPGDPTRARRDPSEIAAYLELHIEQGPRLERAGIALGVVSTIVGIFHGLVVVRGRQDHAGATVMTERKDALAAASEMVVALERIAGSVPDAVGTVGEIAVRPGAKNVIPGECTFSLDIRAPREEDIERVLRELRAEIRRIGDARGVTSSIDAITRVAVTPLDPALRDLLLRSTKAVGVDAPVMVSGAGHDAQNPQLSGVPSGMIFVRSTGGSHTPTESCDAADAALGAAALALAIKELAA